MAPNLKIHNISLIFSPWIALERAFGAQPLETRGSLNVNQLPAVSLNRYLPTCPARVLTSVWQRGTVDFWHELSGETQPVKEHFLASTRSIVPNMQSNWRLWPLNQHSLAVFLRSTWTPGVSDHINLSSVSDSLAVYRATDLAALLLSPWGFQIGRFNCGIWYTTGNLFTRAPIVPCPLGHRSSLIDFVYSWCKIHTQL